MKIFSKLLTLFLVVAMIGLFTNVVYSQEDVKTLSGVVTAVDAENHSLTVKEDKTETTINFIIDEKTVIKRGDKIITLADIYENDSVEVKFVKNTGVKSITVK